jgi:hypothetical protein
MQYYIYRIDRKVYRCNMFKDTCLIALKRKDRSPHILHIEFPCILDLGIFVYLISKVFERRLQNDSLNAQAYNQINVTIITIIMAWREIGCDLENFGTRITWIRVAVKKKWRFEVWRAKLEFWQASGLICKIARTLVKRIWNLERVEGLNYKKMDGWD